ncbi:hypothetical protein Poli38472_004333 [Pythium oligandrum]|uniref:RanBP2-type domain-containing protein n=1 Tax=Pythium oligandrum TaxID=41045 RepID=A0A8K1FFR5_PYTOL|nr:hypothetical protein Poli38472_004333 [Pythium oligandrum]|eukprot:TMW59264.1 hypothetical protein Poli38472_004333 [Pythium oligandrum]
MREEWKNGVRTWSPPAWKEPRRSKKARRKEQGRVARERLGSQSSDDSVLCAARRFAFTRQRKPIAFLTDAKVDFASLDNFESDDEESTKPHKQLSPAQLRFSTKSESAIDLSAIRVEDKFASRCLYITGVTARVSEDALEAICAPLGLEINPESGLPWLDVFICQHTHRPRGDARAVFDSEQSAQHAIEELHNKIFINTRLRAQPMSSVISKILAVQFDGQWTQSACLNTNCSSSVNLIQCRWCSRGPACGSLHEEQWVCNICRTANDPSASFCIGCHPATHFSPSAAKLPKHYFQQCFSR